MCELLALNTTTTLAIWLLAVLAPFLLALHVKKILLNNMRNASYIQNDESLDSIGNILEKLQSNDKVSQSKDLQKCILMYWVVRFLTVSSALLFFVPWLMYLSCR